MVATEGGFFTLGAGLRVSDGWEVGGSCFNTGFDNMTCGSRDLEAKGEGERARRGNGNLWGFGDISSLVEADVIGLFIGG